MHLVALKRQMEPYLNPILIFDHSGQIAGLQTSVLLLFKSKKWNQKHPFERNIA